MVQTAQTGRRDESTLFWFILGAIVTRDLTLSERTKAEQPTRKAYARQSELRDGLQSRYYLVGDSERSESASEYTLLTASVILVWINSAGGPAG